MLLLREDKFTTYKLCWVSQLRWAVSTIFCFQYDTNEWHKNLYDPTPPDAICDCIIYNTYTAQIEGESIHKRKDIPE